MNTETRAIEQAVARVLAELPPGVILVAAAKDRTPEEVAAAIRAGVRVVGHNYVQEAERMRKALGNLAGQAQWHMIGHLQRNKAQSAAELFDMVETLDSWRLAEELERRCSAIGKVMPVLMEVNSGREAGKTGVLPKELDELVQRLKDLRHLHLQGLMTMGPRFGDPEEARPYFRATKEAFDRLARASIPNVEMRYLSMGMSNTYLVALEERANMIRLGTRIFGERPAS